MSGADRVRAYRSRMRAGRASSWTHAIGPDMAPVLAAWASLGLRWAPSPAQVTLIRAAAPTMALRMDAGAILRELPRAHRSGRHPAVYMLVKSLLARLRLLVAASDSRGRHVLGHPESDGEHHGDRTGSQPAPGTRGARGDPPPGEALHPSPGAPTLLDRLRRSGLDDDLFDAWSK